MTVFSLKKKRFAALFFSLSFLVFHFFCFYRASGAAPIVPSQRAESLKETIRLLEQAREHVIDDYNTSEQQGILGPTDQHDYQLFIGYLDSRIGTYCQELYDISGSGAIADLPCAYSIGSDSGENEPVQLPSSTAVTTDEQISELDESLITALGRFDDMLLKEQESIATHVPSQRESGSGSPGGIGATAGNGTKEGDGGDAAGRKDSHSGEAGKESSSQNEKGVEGSKDSQQGVGAGNGTQETVPESSSSDKQLDARDDDVVARQLREAAEKETDPEVKKKLWEEYRKYKEGTR